MNFLKSGPEIKLPSIQGPGFLADLFHDLRDRHLLPLVGLLIVAIIAVPILLSESSEGPGEAELNSELAALSAAPGGEGGVVVANAAPGLRDYRRRLSDLQATDPFKQHFTAASPTSAATEAAGGEASITSESAGGEEVGVSTETGGGSTPSGENNETAVVRTETQYASYEIDARIVNVGTTDSTGSESQKNKTKTTVRHNLPELTMLPGRDTPVIVFMGVSADSKKAMMLVSSDVQSIFGDALCVIGSQTCQLLAMEPGLPETFVYGGQGHIFRIEVQKIERVVSSHPERATLGSPKGANGAS